MSDLRILALDCATVTGWASNACGGIESGTQRFELRRGSSPGMRFLEFRRWLSGLVVTCRPDVIVYEIAHHRGGAATELCVGFTTRVQEIAVEHGAEYRGVHTGTLKRFAAGHGSADKTAVITAMRERFLRPGLADDNEADALALLAWGMDGFPETEPRKRRKT